ncbi:DUF4145 domain-containing protein [Streptomyces erythrogriseus]
MLGHEPLLVTLGCSAESYVHTDPHAAMVKARLFGEVMTRHLVTLLGVTVPGPRQVDRINALTRSGVLVPQVKAWFEAIRTTGNRAVHEYYANVREALQSVELCFRLGDWLHRSLDQSDTTHRVFLAPAPPSAAPAPESVADQHELEQLRAELDAYRRKLEEARLSYDGKQSRLEREQAAREQAEAELARAEAERAALHDLIAELSDKITELAAPAIESRSVARPLDGPRGATSSSRRRRRRPVRR